MRDEQSIKLGGSIIFLHKNKILFHLPVFSPTFKRVHNDYVIFIDEPKYFFLDAYPEIYEEWPDFIKARVRKEREENAKKQKKNWDTFIRYMNNAGKIVN